MESRGTAGEHRIVAAGERGQPEAQPGEEQCAILDVYMAKVRILL